MKQNATWRPFPNDFNELLTEIFQGQQKAQSRVLEPAEWFGSNCFAAKWLLGTKRLQELSQIYVSNHNSEARNQEPNTCFFRHFIFLCVFRQIFCKKFFLIFCSQFFCLPIFKASAFSLEKYVSTTYMQNIAWLKLLAK